MPKIVSLHKEFRIGSIVANKSHPLLSFSEICPTLISGEPTLISPLMIISEVAKPKVIQNRPESKTRDVQCKCIWYSSSFGKFEESWISSSLLKIVKPQINNQTILTQNTIVNFGTTRLELEKRKIYLKQFGSTPDKENKTISALLSFVGPTMQVIDIVENESKNPLKDNKGNIIRQISNQLAKCKYFNPQSDKFSEIFLPINALEAVKTINPLIISKLKDIIDEGKLIKIKSTSPYFFYTVLKPLRITYRSGIYYVEGQDYLENKINEFELLPEKKQIEYKYEHLTELPHFESDRKKLSYLNITKAILRSLGKNYFWRISYRDFNENVTQRTIYFPSFYTLDSKDENGKLIKIDYVKGTCILRNHKERFFRVDRIQKLQKIDIPTKLNLRIVD